MAILQRLLAANRDFLELQGRGGGALQRLPSASAELAIVTCMDSRLVGLLEPALGIARGDAKVIKNAGAVLTEDVVRSLIAAIYLLGVREVAVIAHLDCGIAAPNTERLADTMRGAGVAPFLVAGTDWGGFLGEFAGDYRGHIRRAVLGLRTHPLLPRTVPYHGMIINPETGRLELVEDGYASVEPQPPPP